MDRDTDVKDRYHGLSAPEVSRTLLRDITTTKDCAYHINTHCSDMITQLTKQQMNPYIFYEIQRDMTSVISTCEELQKNTEHLAFVCEQNIKDITDIRQQLLQVNNKAHESDTRINEFLKSQADHVKQVQEHERQIVMYKSAIKVIFVLGAFLAGAVGIIVNLKNVLSSFK